jgi:hypothetical protein
MTLSLAQPCRWPRRVLLSRGEIWVLTIEMGLAMKVAEQFLL